MRTMKLHRVVSADFTVLMASLQSEQAIACAENEGWPAAPDMTAPAVAPPAPRLVQQPSWPALAASRRRPR